MNLPGKKHIKARIRCVAVSLFFFPGKFILICFPFHRQQDTIIAHVKEHSCLLPQSVRNVSMKNTCIYKYNGQPLI